MRTELLITRERTFYNDHANLISLAEWLAAVATDSELKVSQCDEQYALIHWISHRVHGDSPAFTWCEDGDILVELQDRKTLGKALQLARLLDARVLDSKDQEYRSTDDFPSPLREPPPVAPKNLLGNLRWSFPSDAPTERVAFEATVWQRQYERWNDDGWDPEEVVLGSPRVRFSYLCWRGEDQIEPIVELTSDNGVSFRAGELLFKVHCAIAADLKNHDHRFLEGMTRGREPEPGEPPFYYLALGS